MKFTKIALAVAVASAAVAAQAQTANVTLYGYINTSIESNRGSNATGSKTLNRMTANSSRFGFRGSESLGGGMNAFFQLENSFGSDDGSLGGNVMWGREAWVGLNGGFGEVKVGYGLTPYDDVLGLSHQNIGSTGLQNRNNGVSGGVGFGTQQLFTNYGRGGTPGCGTDSNFDARAANAISYKSPNMGGLTIRTMYSLIEETSSGNCKLWDTSAVYANGPITAGLT
ncbi:MAG TPA: porin, partial [Casimicrobium sp.]|nr:porin [Casimicrobium sp.]